MLYLWILCLEIIYIYIYIYIFTPRSTVLLEKLTCSQIVKNLPTSYGTQWFITAFTSARHLSLSWSSFIQSMSPSFHFPKIQINIILPSTPGSPKWSFSLRCPYQNPVYASPLLHTLSTHHPSHSSRFYRTNNIGWVLQIIKLLIR